MSVVGNIKPKQAKAACEFTQVAICDKSKITTELQSFFLYLRWTSSDWKNLNFHIAHDRISEIDRLSIQQNQIDFWMRYAAGFDHIFYGCLFRQSSLNNSGAYSGAEEKIKISVKVKPDCERLHVTSRFAHWRKRTQRWLHAVDLVICPDQEVHLRRSSSQFAIGVGRRPYP